MDKPDVAAVIAILAERNNYVSQQAAAALQSQQARIAELETALETLHDKLENLRYFAGKVRAKK